MSIISIALAIAFGVFVLPGAGAAEPALKRIGILAAADFPAIESFRQEMHERGWVERKNVSFEYRWAEQSGSRYPALAAELASRKVDCVAPGGLYGQTGRSDRRPAQGPLPAGLGTYLFKYLYKLSLLLNLAAAALF